MGLTTLAAPTEPRLEIIAVRGLNGHAYGTWTCREESRANIEPMWLRDFLPGQIPIARILVYGYNSAVTGPNIGVSGVRDFAHDLLQRITDDRAERKDNNRPLISSATHLALVFAHASHGSYSGVESATSSIVFLATPHGGSRSANIGSLLSNVAALAFQRPSKQLLEALKLDSHVFSRLAEQVVDEISSLLGVEDEVLVPIDATHSRICKFNSPSDALFLPVLAQIKRLSENCTGKQVTSETDQENLQLPATGPSEATQRGHFFVPLSPNPQFFGRTAELRLIDDHLNAQEHQNCSNYPISAVHGLGGIGKTQLILKYIYDRREAKPRTSIFWISARSQDDIESGYKAISKELSLMHGLYGSVQHNTQERDEDTFTAAGPSTSADGVALLKDWLLLPGHEDWLLVLDNYDDIQVDIHKFLPIGANGNVLITTRDRRVIGPVADSGFALSAMDLLDTERLFLRVQSSGTKSDWNEPISHPEYRILGQILQEIQCFPLAIDQAVSFIRENSPMSLQEYLNYLKPRSVDRERLLRFKHTNPKYPDSVMTTWEISLDYLERTQP
ncbi:hypothetical protein ABVK25_010351 [Lepraria finkii]|uniref:NB-ARC domain-containing protein n=1 Tax=Lepraria finkii TaxID=1340010 RepID=A0ABR4AWZ7_9LECA